MRKSNYIKIILIILIFVSLNFFSLGGSGDSSSGLDINFYPQDPYDVSLLNTDTTLTLQIQNEDPESKEVKYWISDKSEDLFVCGRDGERLPITEKIGGQENYYYSFALIPESSDQESLEFQLTFVDMENNFLISENFSVEIYRPILEIENLRSIITQDGELSSDANYFLIPRYRRYWHPKRSELGESLPGYVWLAVDGAQNVLIDDGSGDIVARNLELPWDVSAVSGGEARLWDGSGFEEKYVPSPIIEGDNSYNRERFELYYAARENNPAWVTRRIFYWTSENLFRGGVDEVPDTERVELWVSAENGESLSTISDYHHYTFRYKPVERYTIQTFYHCPLPMGAPLLWSDFVLMNYNSVYPLAEVEHDHLGFSKKVHPIDRAIEEKGSLVKRNLIGLGIAALIIFVPYVWERRTEDDSSSN